MAQQAGFLQYATIYPEVTFNTKPGSPTYTHLPVLNYGLKFRPENRASQPFTGLLSAKHTTKFRGLVSGPISVPTYGWVKNTTSLMQKIWDWGFDYDNPDALYLPSYGAEWGQAAIGASVNHTGLRVNSISIQGDDGSGTVVTNLDIIGKAEANQASLQAIPADLEALVEAEFAECVFKIDVLGGTPAAIGMANFNLTQTNGIVPVYLNSFTPTYLPRTDKALSFSVQLLKENDDYDVFNRTLGASEFVGQLIIKALHNGTGATGDYTVCTIDMPRMSLLTVPDDVGGRNAILQQTLNFTLLKPDTSDKIIDFTFTEE